MYSNNELLNKDRNKVKVELNNQMIIKLIIISSIVYFSDIVPD